MAKRSLSPQLIITLTSFIGGMAVGILCTSKAFSDKGSQLTHQCLAKSREELGRLRSRIFRKITHHMPDLYEATSRIEWGEDEF